jgi:hypothetical protein
VLSRVAPCVRTCTVVTLATAVALAGKQRRDAMLHVPETTVSPPFVSV